MDFLTIENSTLRTWPALEQHDYDGWVLRFANGYTGRSNSAIALYHSSLDVHQKIDHCEAQYHQRGLTPRFRMIPHVHPHDLDTVLEQRGYVQDTVSWVMVLDMVQMPPFETDVEVRLERHFSDVWAEAFCCLNPAHARQVDTVKRLLPMIQLPAWYASVIHEGEIVAVAMTVQDGAYAGVFDVATREDMRGKGFGKILIGSLLNQARRDEVKFMYLQMLASNTPAYRLYTHFGFREAYPYWYRTLSR